MQQATLRTTGKGVVTLLALLISVVVVQAASAGEATTSKLSIEKTAEAKSYVGYEWKIEKTVDRNEIVLTTAPTAPATYIVSVERSGGTEYGWQVWGDITVTNETQTVAEIDAVTDTISGHGDVLVHCEGPGFPLELDPGQTLNCHYGPVRLTNGTSTTNTATVSTSAASAVSGDSHTVDIDFGTPHFVNDTIMVVDDYATPDYTDDDIWWEFKKSGSVKYERTYWCKDAGSHTNTATILDEIEGLFDQQLDGPNVPVNVVSRSASATVNVSCDTSQVDTGDQPTEEGGSTPAAPVSKTLVPSATTTDLSCVGANAKRGSRGDTTWSLLGPKGRKTAFFLSNRSYWRVLRLGDRATNPYFRLSGAYTMVKLHQLNGTASKPAVEKALRWTARYLATHRAGYSKLQRRGWSQRNKIVKRLQRVMRRHARALERYAGTIDASRCTTS